MVEPIKLPPAYYHGKWDCLVDQGFSFGLIRRQEMIIAPPVPLALLAQHGSSSLYCTSTVTLLHCTVFHFIVRLLSLYCIVQFFTVLHINCHIVKLLFAFFKVLNCSSLTRCHTLGYWIAMFPKSVSDLL